MNGNLPKTIDKALFHTALELHDPVARQAFLLKACGDDHAQLTRISAWLGSQAAADTFFRDAHRARSEVREEIGITILKESLPGDENQPASLLPENEPREIIGNFRLTEKLGEGGCGIVYLAEQDEPIRRKVAIKLIRRGLDSARIIERFEIERQTLALMDHPNIARVFDAGSTVSGRPYFVMELVLGLKITEHCDSHRLSLRQRLELFLQVCFAIQHAHQKGIIHRDIKPSNILVASQSDVCVPKVIDFGIARAIEREFPNGTAHTTWGHFIGTPAYMSPEQVDGGQEADTRSDVYSLGALLYELITGAPPFDNERLAKAGILEMSRILHEEAPPLPTARLKSLTPEMLTTIITARDTTPAQLLATAKGDLECIVVKAMAKNIQDRYESVDRLALDIKRYLDGSPILARPPSRLYPLRKWILRNKLASTATIVGILALVSGFTTSSWFYFRERDARQDQENLRKIAEQARANESQLLQQATARESISQAAMLLAEGKIAEADALLLKTPVTSIYPSMEAANVFRLLGDWNAIRQRWKQAGECYSLYLQANQRSKNPAMKDGPLYLISLGPSFLLAGNITGYDRFRHESIARIDLSTISPVNASILLKAFLLKPADESLLKQLRPVAKRLASIQASSNRGGINEYQCAFMAMSLAAMEYRERNFPVAQYWCIRGLDSTDQNQARSAGLHAIYALAAHQLNQDKRAELELSKAARYFSDPFSQDNYYPRGEGQGLWQDWSIARIFMMEASAVIGKPAQ